MQTRHLKEAPQSSKKKIAITVMSLESYALKLGSENCPNNSVRFFKIKKFSPIQVNGEVMEA